MSDKLLKRVIEALRENNRLLLLDLKNERKKAQQLERYNIKQLERMTKISLFR